MGRCRLLLLFCSPAPTPAPAAKLNDTPIPHSNLKSPQVEAFKAAHGFRPSLKILTLAERPPEEAQRCVRACIYA